MFTVTRQMMMAEQYWVVGVTIGIVSLLLIFLLREPTLKLGERNI